jgi:WD40 repeat protein
LGDAAHAGKLTAAVWDASPGKRLLTIPEKDFEEIGRLSWSPDGKQIVLSRITREKELKKQIVIWDLASAKEVQSLDIPCQTLKIDWFMRDQIAFDCYARTNIWDLKQGTQWETSGPIGYPEINPRGNLAVSSAAMQGMRLWEFPAGGELALLQAQSDWFSSFAFNQDGRLLAGLTDHGELVTWDVSKYY